MIKKNLDNDVEFICGSMYVPDSRSCRRANGK